MSGRLAGRVAIVTGSGSGIGRATALKLAGEGATVVVNDIRADPAEATVRDIRAAGGQAEAWRADVRVRAEVDALVDETVARFGQLDVLHNNAGGGNTVRSSFPNASNQWTVVLDDDDGDWDAYAICSS